MAAFVIMGLALLSACSGSGNRFVAGNGQVSTVSVPPSTEPAKPVGQPWSQLASGSTTSGDWTVFTTAASENARCFATKTASTDVLGGPTDRYQGQLPTCGYLPSRSTVIQFLASNQVTPLSSAHVALFLVSDSVTAVASDHPLLVVESHLDERLVISIGDSLSVGFHFVVTDANQGVLLCQADGGLLPYLRCGK
ncbi:MAG: hypothetical protein QOD92_1811 [Acidimicrobiaceae bacterium]|jgi:hypothetical protein